MPISYRVPIVSNQGMGTPILTPKEWAEPIATYTTWLRAAHRPETTIYLRGYQLRRFAVTMKTRPFDVTTQTLIDYLSMHDWSAETMRSARSGLRSFYTWAHATGRVSEDPAAGLPTISTQIGKPRPAPESAIQHGLAVADQRDRLMIDLAAYAGLRCCEICRVHSDDVGQDLLGWTLRVVGKGRKIRVVPVTALLAHRIRAAYGFVFPGQIDGHLSSAYVSKRISWVLPEGWTAHTLRHRFASAAYAGERDIRAVQELLGHSSVATTQRYTAIPDGASRRAMIAAAG